MEIRLLKLELENFKGIKKKAIDFGGKDTVISGANATGKTTIVDAFTWLLFDKDSSDRSSFSIKTHDDKGQAISGLSHTVTALLSVNNKEMELSKTYEEKWTKRRGEAAHQLTGHTTTYSIDGVPVKKSEYNDKIENLVDVDTFKLVANPLYFSEGLHWEKRRDLLMEILGELDDTEVLKSNVGLSPLDEVLSSGEDIAEFEKKVKAKKRKLNEQIKTIPTRIDEVHRGLPEEEDLRELERKAEIMKGSIEKLDQSIESMASAAEEREKKKVALIKEEYLIKGQIAATEEDIKKLMSSQVSAAYNHRNQTESEMLDLRSDRHRLENGLQSIDFKIESKTNELAQKKKETEELRDEFFKVDEEQLELDDDVFICPTCKQDLPPGQIESKRSELVANFEKRKDKTLARIRERGRAAADCVKALNDEIAELQLAKSEEEKDISAVTARIEDLAKELESELPKPVETDEIKKLKETIEDVLKPKLAEVRKKLDGDVSVDGKSDLKDKKRDLVETLEGIRVRVQSQKQREKGLERITELEKEEQNLAQEIAKLEGQEFLVEEFAKTKVNLLESRVNEKFKTVGFKLFNQLVNGGIEPTCEALIGGVPYPDANNAAKINSGLEIIDVISDHYGVRTPIFIDNSEAVNELYRGSGQMISLRVTGDKELKIKEEL